MPDQPMEERIREALEAHAGWGYDFDKSAFRTTMTCSCGEWSEYLEPGKSTEAKFRTHTVAVLAGIVREAQAKALEDAGTELAQLPYARPGAPERQEYERLLAIRRGNTDAWLRARAEQIRKDSK